jgi:hypothetical protein
MAAKKTNYTPYLIGAGALGILAYLFKDDLKTLFKRSNIPNDEEPSVIGLPPTVPEKIITPNGVTTVKTDISKGLNPIGTPKDKLNLDIELKPGMRGQEVAKLQQILNRIAKITGKPSIQEDGIYGDGTNARLTSMFKTGSTNLFKAYNALFAIYAASQGKALKKWFDVYQTYLSSPQLRQAGRTQYFKNNTLI